MLLLLLSLVLFSTAWSQSNDTCPTSCSSQQTLANVTAQLRQTVASYDQKQSSESLTNLLQLILARQLTRELDHSTPATGNSASSSAANNSCDCSEILSTTMQLTIKSMDTTKAIRNLRNNSMDNTEKIRELSKEYSNNREAISNLTTLVQRLAKTWLLLMAIDLLLCCTLVKRSRTSGQTALQTTTQLMAVVATSTVRWNRFVAVVAG